ncbi:MAG: glycoside hydrolase family 15 protein [Chloroflexota bacterium]
MPLRIEDYALIGDTHTGALVGSDGSIDWLCLPRFDSAAAFAALLGGPQHGRWLLAPAAREHRVRRKYRGGTLVLETEFQTDTGAVRLIDCMPHRHEHADVVRIVEGLSGRVRMRMELALRFDYGQIEPWMRRLDDRLLFTAGPDGATLQAGVATTTEDMVTRAEFVVAEGQRVPFLLSWFPSHTPLPECVDAERLVTETEAWWRDWTSRLGYRGEWRDAVLRSAITLKALTYEPTGGIVAALTTSLPEKLGGVRNWDYRYVWLRDAAFTLDALTASGYLDEARAWRDWLLRAAAGDASKLQVMYGPAGERRLPEMEAGWLPGYEGSRPVRIGNAAVGQFQLDVFGEVMDALHLARQSGMEPDPAAWALQRAVMEFLESSWQQADQGIWEVRGPRRQFTHSKVMAWVAFDRAVQAVERSGLPGPIDRWRRLRAEVHADVCRQGYDGDRQTFTQSYGSPAVDASLLLLPLVGFLPASDERVRGTVAAVERELCQDGFVLRYATDEAGAVDGLPPGEGAFLACSFWLVDNLTLLGRHDDARQLCQRLLGLQNDVGLLAEQYDVGRRRLVGNFPQAFSHVALINTAHSLSRSAAEVEHQAES